MKIKLHLLSICLLLCSCGKKELNIFTTNDLLPTVNKLQAGFIKSYGKTKMLTVTGEVGTNLTRKVQGGSSKSDIALLSDSQIFDKMLIPGYFEWYIIFAQDKIVLGCTDDSKYVYEINDKNWHKTLLKKDTRVGYADPNENPCGYQTIFVWQLADDYYASYNRKKGERIKKGIPRAFKKHCSMRPDLLSLILSLKNRNLDYVFMYQSTALQNNLKYITLPDALDLSNPILSNFYTIAKMEFPGGTGQEGKKTIIGSPVALAISIANKATNYSTAIKFIKFVLSKKGQKILKKQGISVLASYRVNDLKKVPKTLRR